MIWVWQRQTGDVLLELDPKALWEKHEARKMFPLRRLEQREATLRGRSVIFVTPRGSNIGYRSGVRAGCWGSGEERSVIS